MIIEINPVNCGIYSITHKDSGQAYVGSSIDIRYRICQHLKKLSKGQHENPKMQSLYDVTEGNTAFECRIIEACPEEDLDDREQFHIDTGNSQLNISKMKFGRYARKVRGRKPNGSAEEAKTRKTRSDKGETRKPKTPEQITAANTAKMARYRARKKAEAAANSAIPK
ncbi:GIY-YIG nuclease family protein [Ensifer canadensis]